MQDALVLRDVHQPPAPPLWPPAPGWWFVGAAVLIAALAAAWFAARRRRRRRAVAALFDDTLALAGSPAERVAAVSGLLRRAGRRRDAAADRLQGEEWLRLLDGDDRGAPFSAGPGRLLLEGAFRRDVDPAGVDALVPLARRRFLAWMEGR